MSAELNRSHIDRYIDSLISQRKLSHHTITNYAHDLSELYNFIGDPAVHPAIESVTHVQIRKFASQLHARGLSARSIARKLSAWRGFFDWLSQETAIATNPVTGVKAPRRAKPLPKALSADDAVHLMSSNAAGDVSNSATHLCNLAMFELLYSSGLRVSELAGLDVRYFQDMDHTSMCWIDVNENTVTVTGKGKKMRSVPVGSHAIKAITAWLAIRPTLLKVDPHPLFLTERGTRISVRLVQLRIKAHAQGLGIPTNVHPHVLRHSFASHVLQSSGDLRAVQEMLGHASIASTQVYTSLDFQHLAQVYDAAHPRAKKKDHSGSE